MQQSPEGDGPIRLKFIHQWGRGVGLLLTLWLIAMVGTAPVYLAAWLAGGGREQTNELNPLVAVGVVAGLVLGPILAYRLAWRMSFGFFSWCRDQPSADHGRG